jgi:hypothetical protein
MEVLDLGRYRIVRELGRGAMGRVFLAHDPQIDRPVAIKTVQIFAGLPEAEREKARERFLREARSAGKLLHPGIVTIFDVGEAGGVPYIAMEYVEGEALDRFCSADSLLEVGIVVESIARIAEALAYAHAAGIVHRDIKPANILRVGPTATKIMDFGLAKDPTTSMTHDGSLFGTPNYMAPEQVKGAPIDGRADLFALGVVLFEMLTGERPFGGDSVSSVLFRIVHEAPRDIGPHLHRLPAALGDFLARALAKEPAERFPDGATFAAELRQAARVTAAPSSRPRASAPIVAPAPSIGATKRRTLLPYVAGAAVVVSGLAALAYLVGRREPAAVVPASFSVFVRTEPTGQAVMLDGRPVIAGRVEVPAAGPFGTLVTTSGCRSAKHEIAPGDAGRTLTLVLDPERQAVAVDAGVEGASLRVNGAEAGASPRQVELDLCRENVIEASSPGYASATVIVPSGATPLEAVRVLGALRLAPLPTGTLVLPSPPTPVTFFVDGRQVARARGGMELPVGEHEVRALNEEAWIDVRSKVMVEAGRTVDAPLAIPPPADLVVQAFPPNAKVYLKRGTGPWVYLDDVPVERTLAAGRYGLRVEFVPTGETKEQEVVLRAGQTAQIRLTFAMRR